jgi:hypothetical protein
VWQVSLALIRQPPHVLDPSDPEVIGRLIADTLLVQPRHRLSEVSKFYGSSVYAIYYTGAFHAYDLITETDKPIYVGKADPATSDAISQAYKGLLSGDGYKTIEKLSQPQRQLWI